MSSLKSKRGNNFSTEEELLMLDEIGKYKNVFENKKTNNISSNEKNEAWKKVVKGFNSNNLYPRTLDQVKSKYDHLKTKARKWVADKKTDFKGTGSGPGTNSHSDPVLEAVINIINFKTVCGLVPIYDDDVEDTLITTENEIECEQPSRNDSVPRTSLDLISMDGNNNIIFYYEDADHLDTVENSPLAKKVKRAVNKEIQSATDSKEQNLKVRVSFIEDIKRKAKEEEIKFKENKIIANNKKAREQEEHAKGMTLLDLQIRKTQNSLGLSSN